jgi:hypothetical protein
VTKKHSLGGPKHPDNAEATGEGGFSPLASQEAVGRVLGRFPAERATEAPGAVKRNDGKTPTKEFQEASAEILKTIQKNIDRTAKVRAKVDKCPELDPSLAAYLVTNAVHLDDKQVDKMIDDFNAGLVVAHGASTWGEPKPKS